MSLKVYSYPGNPRVWKAEIAAQFTGAKIELTDFQMGVTNKSPEFLKLNPFGRVPTMQTPEGGLFESNAIAQYVAAKDRSKGLLGANPYEEALVIAYMETASSLASAQAPWFYGVLGYRPYERNEEAMSIATTRRYLEELNAVIKGRSFLVGNQVTLADICLAMTLVHGFSMFFDASFRAGIPDLVKYFDGLLALPQFKAVVKEFKYCETAKTAAAAVAHPAPNGQERTYIMIKPDGVQRGLIGDIIARFEKKGFTLVALKMVTPTLAHAEKHYADLSKKPFFGGLTKFLSSGPVCCMVWQGKNVVKTGRVMLGATNPADSAPGTIRGDLCVDIGRNICHGSDSVESAKDEINLWFTPAEINSWTPTENTHIYE